MFENVLYKTYWGNTGKEFLIALLIILCAFIIGKALYWFFSNVVKKLTSKTKTKLDDIIVDMIEEPIVFALIIAGIWFGFNTLTVTEKVNAVFGNIFQILIVINIAWLLTRLFESLFEEYLVPLADKSETDLDDQLMPIVRKGTKAVVWIFALIIALNNAGYNITTLLTGLGIGGLAFAMAAKDTVSNIFGGFTIFTDKPFKIKDRIKVSGYDGFVEEIGLRSSRIRTLDGTVVTIPNSQFSDAPVENVSMEPSRKITLNLGLTYDTTPEKMNKALSILKKIAKANEQNINKGIKLSFNGFGDFAMNIMFIYYIRKGKDILETQTDMNTAILKEFNKNKLEFAFPTQTIYSLKG